MLVSEITPVTNSCNSCSSNSDTPENKSPSNEYLR